MTSRGQVVSSHSLRWGQSSFCTQACIDSRRSSCSSVNSRCWRFAAWSGLTTVAVVTWFAPCPRSSLAPGARACEKHRVLLHTLWYRAPVAEQLVLYEVDAGVATVTLNDPDKRNRLSAEMLAQLVEAIRRARDGDDVRALVLTGAGKAFCAGADLGGFGSDAPVIQKHL